MGVNANQQSDGGLGGETFPAEPFRTKVVEPLRLPARRERERLIKEAGVRGVELGTCAFGKVDEKGKAVPHAYELLRLAVPRRVYSGRQLNVAAEALGRIRERAKQLKGFRLVEGNGPLRHFVATFATA